METTGNMSTNCRRADAGVRLKQLVSQARRKGACVPQTMGITGGDKLVVLRTWRCGLIALLLWHGAGAVRRASVVAGAREVMCGDVWCVMWDGDCPRSGVRSSWLHCTTRLLGTGKVAGRRCYDNGARF
jgi:hypothetical protein